MMTSSSFFDESRQQSQIKFAIVAKYFMAWTQVIIATQNKRRQHTGHKIAYIDLFAGPGRYSDGTISTPLLVLKEAIPNEILRERLVTIFNDKDGNNTNSLSQAINQLPGVHTLKYQPQVYTHEIGEDIVKVFEDIKLAPTFFFVDPWGYKGLSLRLVNSVIKDWGCDCIFFFNYSRINMGLSNDAVREHMNALFGEEQVDELRERLIPLGPKERELTIVETLCQALRNLGPEYVLPFCFKDDHGSRTSHHLIFASKAFKGYEIMKEIMAKESTYTEQDVANFQYNPVDATMAGQQQLLFELARPLDDLGDMLLQEFAGQTLTMYRTYKQHNVNRPYIKRNYKEVLRKLEEQQAITTSPHRKGSFADYVEVNFSRP